MKLEENFDLEKDFAPPSIEEWRIKVETDLKGMPVDKLKTKTYEGIDLQPIYTKADIQDIPHLKDIPGRGTNVRGNKPEGYSVNSWEVSQELPFGLAEDFNQALTEDLKRGQTSVNLKLDDATLLGLDADYADKDKVGNKGVSISAINSMSKALENVDVTTTPVNIEGGFSSLPIFMIYQAFLKKNNIDADTAVGSITADPLGYLAEYGEIPVSTEYTFNKMKYVTEWSKKNCKQLKTIGVSGLPYHNAGASAVQELAFVISTAVEYINQLTGRGLSAEEVAKNMRFTFGVGPFYFMEVAKLRAAKILWSKITEEYGVSEDYRKMFIHARTSSYNQTVYDPYVNMLRTTTEAFSAIVGGVDSLHTNQFDERFGTPDTFSRRISRNTQIILNEESHLHSQIDPAGGSFFVEKLTSEVAEAAWKLFQEVESKGGMLKALEEGFPQTEIEKTAELRKKDLAKRKSVLVGTNMYANMKEEKLASKFPDTEAIYNKRSEYLQKFRVAGEDAKHKSILEKLQDLVDAKSVDMITTGAEAILEGATIGEISKSCRANESTPFRINPVRIHKLADPFEDLRDRSTAFEKKNGSKPKIFLATMGPVKQHKGRADFSRGFFEVGGMEVIYPAGFDTTGEAVKAAVESGAKAVCICSSDETYPDLVSPIVKGVKENNSDAQVILAGYPKDQVEAHKSAGVDDFIFLGADALQILTDLLNKIGA
ncbi:MAG: acyl-CoA mutase large subunit family protein [Bacteroidetes bacterium]|nr:acyl-CoA mutase large subunit family protein [Bacteroidota bacterium]